MLPHRGRAVAALTREFNAAPVFFGACRNGRARLPPFLHSAMRRLGRVLLDIVAVSVALPLAYLLAAWLGGRAVIATEGEGGDAEVSVFLLSNGVHTDIAVPLRHEVFDWTRAVSPADTRRDSSGARYVAFGWGDRGFYVETPHWRDLKIGTALRAVSGLGDSVIHATFYAVLYEAPDSIRLDISRRQYRAGRRYPRVFSS